MGARIAEKRDLSRQDVLDAIQPKAAEYYVWDSTRPGFGLKIWPSRTRSWIYMYKTQARVLRKMTLGDARVMTFDEAHAHYVTHARTLKNGADPMASHMNRRATTVEKQDLSQQDVVDAIRSQKTRYSVWDTVRPGLGLTVYPSGQRRWVYQFVTKERKPRQRIIGDANVMTFGEAFAQWTTRKHELHRSAITGAPPAWAAPARPAWAVPVDPYALADALAVDNRALRAEIIRLNETSHRQSQRIFALEHLSHPATT